MTETISEKTTNDSASRPVRSATGATAFQTIEYLVYYFFGVLEALLVFRLVLKLAGASAGSGFVRFVYGMTGLFISPFEGIFRRGFAPGAETTSVFEPSTLVAIIVYALVAWGIVKLVRIGSRDRQTS
ncbi:MAG TPA: YggT family protein [Candidatus Fimivivens sp.]|nr:YggT family protein [Candidatus Fimivivens sp.]